MKNVALITGVTGQDGSYLAEFLLEKGYEVHGLVRRHSIEATDRIDHLIASSYHNVKFFLHYADTTDSSNMIRLVSEIKPTEVYNLAAQSHVGISFEVPEYTADATGTSLEQVTKDTDRDYWLDADEAVKYGLISKIVSKREELPAK